MKTTEELIRDEIWCGLNNPNADIKDADVVILGIPFDEGVSFRDGAGDAPQHIRSITYTSAPSTEYFEDMFNITVKDIGDFKGADRDRLFHPFRKVSLDL